MKDIKKKNDLTNDKKIETEENAVIKTKKFESRANYAGNQEVIDEENI